MDIAKTLRLGFSIRALVFEKSIPSIFNINFQVLRAPSICKITEGMRASPRLTLCYFDRHGPYLDGVEDRFAIEALCAENGVHLYSPLFWVDK